MGFFPFKTIKDYSEMLNRIGVFTFISSIFILFLLKKFIIAFDQIITKYSLTIPYFGIPIPIGIILPSFLITIIFRMFKIHDRISDIFRIRHNFDVNHILVPMANKVGIIINDEMIKIIFKNRHSLMPSVFYKYASSKSKNPQIDPHLIEMALDQWSWFWVIIESSVILLFGSIILYFFRVFSVASGLIGLILLLIVFLNLILKLCSKYALNEVDAIVGDPNRKKDIKEVFYAL